MPLNITELHPSPSAEDLASEWFILENTGPTVFNAKGCTVAVSKKGAARPRAIGSLDPGFVLQPGEKIRVVTGKPRKGEGADTAEGKTYYLFIKERLLATPGTTLHFALHQQELARATFTPGK